MNRFPRGRTWIATLAVLFLTLSATRAGAQDAAPPPGGLAAQGPMRVEPLREGWAIAPEVKMTRFDGGTHTLAGVSGGWVLDDALLIGAGGYWLADSSRTRKLSYGGAVVEWRQGTGEMVGFALKGLLGVGTATTSQTITLVGFDRDENGARAPTSLGSVAVAFRQDFFVAEPQADLLVRLGPNVRLHLGGGYRLVGSDRRIGSEIRGATGSVSLEFGPR